MKKYRKKTLSHYIIRKYLSFLILLLVLFSVIYNVSAWSIFGGSLFDYTKMLDAASFISKDYENTDTADLESIGGWIEILDDDLHVIYTKGNAAEPRSSYTYEELLRQNCLSGFLRENSVTIAGILSITRKSESADIPAYAATYTTFEKDGQTLIGIAKFPTSNISARFEFLNPAGNLGRKGLISGLCFFLPCLAALLFCLLKYARSINLHVAAPNDRLVQGLRRITSGDYDTQICLNAEYEYREIEDSFNQLACELKNAASERERLESERRQLLSNIAHDLKTPITTLQGYARALNDHIVDSPEQTEEYLNAIYRKSVQMTELVNKLLAYSRLENDSYPLDLRKTEFIEFVRTVVIDEYDQFEKHGMTLELDIPDTEIFLNIDRTELRRVIQNLIGNCLKHNPAGTRAVLSVSAPAKSAASKSPDASGSGDETGQSGTFSVCTLELWDNGVPVPPSLKASIFEPFVCGDQSRRSQSGSGLGLSICRIVAKKHGGNISLEERKDGYKGFVLRLPLPTAPR